jgi:hypothetical protein
MQRLLKTNRIGFGTLAGLAVVSALIPIRAMAGPAPTYVGVINYPGIGSFKTYSVPSNASAPDVCMLQGADAGYPGGGYPGPYRYVQFLVNPDPYSVPTTYTLCRNFSNLNDKIVIRKPT